MRAQVGQVINNKYRLLRLIGDGGMGSVYEARHEVLGTSVALKFLHPELMQRPGLVARFLQEAKVSAQIQSPHVIRVLDVDQAPTGAFIVLEYLEGRTLQTLYEDLYRAGDRLSYGDALEYAVQMIEGVEAAHKKGVVHRDLKPDNVMITVGPKGHPLLKVLDFGIAKLRVSGELERGLTKPGVIMGTPEYMAPEQAYSADQVDARADIFSLGVMIFEMLAGRRPVGGDDPALIATAYMGGQIASLTELAPDIAPELAVAVHKAMAAYPVSRFQTVGELRDAIAPFAEAAKAPSVLSAISSPNLSQVSGSPRATPGEARAVPKTLPPESAQGDAKEHAADAKAAGAQKGEPTNPGEPPDMEGAPSQEPEPASDPSAAPVAYEGAAGPAVPPTAAHAPLQAGFNGAATALAAPYVPGLSPQAPARNEPVAGPARTDVGDGFGGGTAIAPPYTAPSQTPPMGAPRGPGSVPVPPRSLKARDKGKGASLLVIMLLAAGVSAAVVGGLYVAQSRAHVDDHDDTPVKVAPTSPPPKADPPPSDPGPGPAPAPTPTQVRPYKPRPPVGPNPNPGPGPAPGPSAGPGPRPPIIPSVLPPIVIPSALPFSFPFGPGQAPKPNKSQPDVPRDNGGAPPPPPARYEVPPPPPPPYESPTRGSGSNFVEPRGPLHSSQANRSSRHPRAPRLPPELEALRSMPIEAFEEVFFGPPPPPPRGFRSYR